MSYDGGTGGINMDTGVESIPSLSQIMLNSTSTPISPSVPSIEVAQPQGSGTGFTPTPTPAPSVSGLLSELSNPMQFFQNHTGLVIGGGILAYLLLKKKGHK